MNPVIELLGHFESMANANTFGALALPKGKQLSLEKVSRFIAQLESIQNTYKYSELLGGILISAVCERIVPKSKRIKKLFYTNAKEPVDSYIRGAFFRSVNNEKKHVFIYFLSPLALKKAIERLRNLLAIIKIFPTGSISDKEFEEIAHPKKEQAGKIAALMRFENFNLSRTETCQLICELIQIDHFEEYSGPDQKIPSSESLLIQLIRTGKSTKNILSTLNIDAYELSKDGTTYLFSADQADKIRYRAPFLIGMSAKDSVLFDNTRGTLISEQPPSIPRPTSEPIIGVIDTAFDTGCYFSDWVDYRNSLDVPMPTDETERKYTQNHATKIASIIVDGPALNPNLDDGCGRFRVRLFRLMNGPHEGSSISTIFSKLDDIIGKNRDIRVWNFSLGTNAETSENYISILGAELDRLQFKYDVLFVVSGSNSKPEDKNIHRLGSPADSLNSLVINSVTFDKKPASYSRRGPVLSFFIKPDICYYGGDQDKSLNVWGAFGQEKDSGTSYASAWISRKVAFLMEYMQLPREVTKALLIDSAAGWAEKDPKTNQKLMGFGIVPIRIEDILQSSDDEIKFVIHGICEAYDTYTYKLPIPIEDSKFPYYARAILCYFPEGKSSQGVDYTQTELDLHFGRLFKIVKTDKKTGKTIVREGIKTINGNTQGNLATASSMEGEARRFFSKWDNVKRTSEEIKARRCPRTILHQENPQWGLSIRTKERLTTQRNHNLRFGVVVTLKEMFNQNRFNKFVKSCQIAGWTVQNIDIHTRMQLFTDSNLEISWDISQ